MSDFWVYPASFLAGLGLNLTPCVYPMVSITISIFSVNQSKSLKIAIFRSLAYVSGVIAMYSTLGLIAVLSGGLFGAWMQHRIVVAAIGLIFLALSLSMFGLWRFEAPRFMLDHAAKLSGKGLVGLFLSGLFVGVFAAPCIGPPVAAILAWAGSTQESLKAFFALFLMGLGLGFPYLILSIFASGIKKLPKSGDWLIWFERVFAVILAGFSIYYLSVVFFSAFIPFILPIGLVLGGGYLGFLEKSGESNSVFKWFKRISSILVMCLGILLLQPTASETEGLTWIPFDEPTFMQAVQNGEPTALDFYADWCLPCHEMDRVTYRHPQIINELKGITLFKVDLTYQSPQTVEWSEFFRVSGMPTLIFFDRSGNEINQSRVVGFIDPERLLPVLKHVQQAILDSSTQN